MNEVFADTYFYLALLSRDAPARANASAVARRVHAPTVTTAFVFLEVANALSGAASRASYLRLAAPMRPARM